jgi:hypothetical protein
MSISASNDRAVGAVSRRRRTLCLLWLLPALALLWCGAQRMHEGARTWPLQRYLHAVWWQKGQPPPLGILIVTPPGRADGRAWSGYGQAMLSAAHRASGFNERDRLLGLADAATRRALLLSPAQAATWARLSLIALNRGEVGMAIAALRQSHVLAPNGVNLAWPRAKLGLYLWSGLNPEARRSVGHDIQRLARQPPSLALPYPVAALRRFADGIGRSAQVDAILGKAVARAY